MSSQHQIHPSNDSRYRPTPSLDSCRQPSDGQLATYQTGPNKFPNLAAQGGFLIWSLSGLYEGVAIDLQDFNCISWAVGHTDRWIEPSSVEKMTELFQHYHFVECQSQEAELEVYAILNAPLTLTNPRGRVYPNSQAGVQHAHRRDHPQLDAAPNLGCSSKLQKGPLIAHNRHGLEDTRAYGARAPPITYGKIFQWWRRTPEHPSYPGMTANARFPTGNYPDHQIFASGYGINPPGHPGNHLGLPVIEQTRAGGASKEKKHGGLFSFSRKEKTPVQKKPVQRLSATNPKKPIKAAPKLASRSRPGFAQVPWMPAHGPVPPAGRDAAEWAYQYYKSYQRSNAKLVKDFECRWSAWKKAWDSPVFLNSPRAQDRCDVVEFGKLLEMGAQILPLVIYKLLDAKNFTGVFLYNALERDNKCKVDPYDLINFLCLQRQSNLIIDINNKRKW